jgi:hypothetical protein
MRTAALLTSIVVADRLPVTSLADTLTRIAQDLAEARVGFALIGGLAVSVRTEPGFTRDADLAVAMADDAEAETLIAGLHASGYGIGTVLEQQAVGRLSTVRLLPADRSDDQPASICSSPRPASSPRSCVTPSLSKCCPPSSSRWPERRI